jgi:DNA-binding beta-propeller fold protein YncE
MNKGQIISRRKRLVAVVIVMLAACLLELSIRPPARAQVIIGVIDLDTTGGAVAVNTDTNRVYVSVGSQIHVYDAQTYARITTIALPDNYGACYDVAVNPVTNRVYAIAFRTYVIDGNTNAVLANLPTRGDEAVVNTATNRVYVADRLTDPAVVRVLDGATNTWLPDITVGDPGAIGYIHLAVNPTTNRAYIAFTGDDYLRVLDGSTHAEVTRVSVADIGYVAVNPDTNRVYVGNNSEDVMVLDGATHTPVGAIARLGAQLRLNRLTNRLYGLDPASPGYVVRIADLTTDSVVGYVYLDGNLVDYDVHLSRGQLFGTHATSPSTWCKKMSIIQDASPTSPAPTPPLPRVIATLNLPADGYGVAVNTLTNRLYVGISGGVAVFDATTLAALSAIVLPGDLGSPDVAVDETRNQIYAVTGSETHVISGTNEQEIGNLGHGSDVFVNSTNGRVYVTDTGFYVGEPDLVKIYDGVTLAHIRTLNLGTSSAYESLYMAVNPTTGYAYCTYSYGDGLYIISPATDDVTQTLDFDTIGDVAVNPVTNRVYVRMSRSGQAGILILDGNTHAELGLIEGASGYLETNPQTNRLYGATGSTLFQAYDGDYNRYLGRVFVDAFMVDYAVYPALARLYVTHHSYEAEQSQKLSVIQDTTWTPQWLFLPLVVKNQ